MKKRTFLDWIILLIVVGVAGLVIASSFQNTAKLAKKLNMDPLLAAGFVEILFGSLLLIRGRQRATQRNTPLFLTVGYYGSFIFVTAVNMYGLAQTYPKVGSVVGLSISLSMWLMESILVWYWVDGHKPHQKSLREKKKEAKLEIKEEEEMQHIQYMKWAAKKPNLKLIQIARTEQEKRKAIIGEGLPEYFLIEQEPTPIIVAEPITVDVREKTAEIVPLKRPIGFHTQASNTDFKHVERTPQNQETVGIKHQKPIVKKPVSNTKIEQPKASVKKPSPNTKSSIKKLPANTQKTNKTEQIIEYVIGLIENNKDYSVSSVANTMGCARSTASTAINKAKEKVAK